MSHIFAQDCLNPVSMINIGGKIGTQSVVSLGLEWNLPILSYKLAPFIEFQRLNPEIQETQIHSKYFEYGLNFYFSQTGDKGYLSISRSNLDLDFATYDDGERVTSQLPLAMTNVKLGGKWGKRVFFRLEAGYAFGKIPDTLQATYTDENGRQETESVDLFEENENLKTLFQMGLPILNIGLGVRFL